MHTPLRERGNRPLGDTQRVTHQGRGRVTGTAPDPRAVPGSPLDGCPEPRGQSPGVPRCSQGSQLHRGLGRAPFTPGGVSWGPCQPAGSSRSRRAPGGDTRYRQGCGVCTATQQDHLPLDRVAQDPIQPSPEHCKLLLTGKLFELNKITPPISMDLTPKGGTGEF